MRKLPHPVKSPRSPKTQPKHSPSPISPARTTQDVYKRQVDAVDPGAVLSLDPALLQKFPEGYRHLAYLQTCIGYAVKPDMPGLKGPAVEALYARGRSWLAGQTL